MKEYGADKFEIVVPSISILAEPPVAVVDKVVKKHKTEKVAEAYLSFLYTPRRTNHRGQAFLSAPVCQKGASGLNESIPKSGTIYD